MQIAIRKYNAGKITESEFKMRMKANFAHNGPDDGFWKIMSDSIVPGNIDDKGSVCMSVLKDNWLPSITVENLIGYLKDLLREPNPNDPLMPEIAKLFIENNAKYIEKAREYTKKYAL